MNLIANRALILYVINTAVALAVSWGASLSADQTGAITTIATAVIAIAAAVLTRPVSVGVLTGAAATLLAAFTAFGLHLTADQIGEITGIGSVFLGLLLHQSVSPPGGELDT
jgi:hypothetical protein